MLILARLPMAPPNQPHYLEWQWVGALLRVAKPVASNLEVSQLLLVTCDQMGMGRNMQVREKVWICIENL